MRFSLCAFLWMGLFITSDADSRPVSYPNGWTGMVMNDGMRNSAHIHYSPTAKMSIGYRYEYWRDMDFRLNAVQMNNLLKRWNKRDSQANLYIKSGIGVAHSNAYDIDYNSQIGAFTGIAADWEDRRYFVSYENRYTDAGDISDFFQQSARVGWAPYAGDYGDLHTWLMLKIDHIPEAENKFTITPLIRIFKGVHLIEAGMNNRGEILFNYIFRY